MFIFQKLFNMSFSINRNYPGYSGLTVKMDLRIIKEEEYNKGGISSKKKWLNIYVCMKYNRTALEPILAHYHIITLSYWIAICLKI